MREKILMFIEKNSRVDVKELAVILGVDEEMVEKELKAMEEEHIICGYHTMIDWEKTAIEKTTALIEVRVRHRVVRALTVLQSAFTIIRRCSLYI